MHDLYRKYLSEYIEEADKEKQSYLKLENTVITEKSNKDNVYKRNFYLKENLQDKYIAKPLSDIKNREKIIEFVSNFLDEHQDQLNTSGPVYTFTFSKKETSVLYEIFNLSDEILLQLWENLIKETYYGTISAFFNGWVKNAPHKLLLVGLLIESLQKNYSDVVECCEYIWGFAEYPILYAEYWRTGVKEDVMNYTIERLGNKFKIKVKNLNNLQQLLKYDAGSAIESFKERLIDGADNVYADFMQRMRNQINNTLKNISREYYRNSESNATMHQQQSEFDDGSKADQEGIGSNIHSFIDSTVEKISMGDIISPIVKVVSQASQVDKNNIINFLNMIFTNKNNKINKFVENIIISYFEKNPTATDIGGGDFVNFGLSLYKSLGISKNELYMELRNIMNYWMFDIINIRNMYQREPTIISYNRAIYNYMIFMINYYN